MLLINFVILTLMISIAWTGDVNESKQKRQDLIDLTDAEVIYCGYPAHEIVRSCLNTYNETYARVGEFPWVVRINDKIGYIAAGTLLNRALVLTANQFIKNKRVEDLQIVAGDWDILNNFEEVPELYRTAVRIESNGDIALIFLSMPFSPQEYISGLCLPTLRANFEQKDAATTAWIGNSSNTDKLIKKTFTIQNPLECSDLLTNDTRVYTKSGNFSDAKHICAFGKEMKNPCGLNNGAALFYDIQSSVGYLPRYLMAGITLENQNCKPDLQEPAVFINILPYISWIEETFRKPIAVV